MFNTSIFHVFQKMAQNKDITMFSYANFTQQMLVCKLPPHTVDIEVHVRSSEGTHFYKTDIYNKTVSYFNKWTPRYQPYENVQRKINKVLRKEGLRNPVRNYRDGPGTQSWTRPVPYRRPSSPFPRTVFKKTPTFTRRQMNIPDLDFIENTDNDFIMAKFFEGLDAYKEKRLADQEDDLSSLPSLVTPTPEPASPIVVRPILNWKSKAGTDLIQVAAEAAAQAKAMNKNNDLNIETSEVTPMSSINIHPETCNEDISDTEELGTSSVAKGVTFCKEDQVYQLKDEPIKEKSEVEGVTNVPIYLQQEELLLQANILKKEKELLDTIAHSDEMCIFCGKQVSEDQSSGKNSKCLFCGKTHHVICNQEDPGDLDEDTDEDTDEGTNDDDKEDN